MWNTLLFLGFEELQSGELYLASFLLHKIGIDLLDQVGVKSIIPTEDWEVTGNTDELSNSMKLTKETVSLPIYPSLSNEDVDLIISTIAKK